MISIYKIIQILGLLQGLILFVTIFSNRKNRVTKNRSKSHSYLALLILFLTFHIGAQIFIKEEFMTKFPYILLCIDYLPFLYGPLIYFYIYHLFFKEYKPALPFVIHMIPAFADVIVYSSIFVIGGRTFINQQMALFWEGTPPLYIIVIDLLKFVSGLSYSGLTLMIIVKNRENLKKWVDTRDHKKWLIALITGFVVCWLPVIVASVVRIGDIGKNTGDPAIVDTVIINTISTGSFIDIISSIQIVLLAIFLYIITFFTLKYPAILNPKQIREEIKKKLNLGESEIKEIKKRLEEQIKKEIYLDPDLTLEYAAKVTETHSNRLSFVINEEYNTNFKQYINLFRLEKFIELAKTSQIHDETILGLALDSGFPSKSTFHRVFKEKYQLTATEYLKQGKK